jgi:ADP-heptose:LPS heptosyltransferase
MKNYLFFRTDRVGDFLISSILLKSIKRNDPSSNITVVASNKNYLYINSMSFVDSVILYPTNPIKKIFFILSFIKKNYSVIGVLDGKKRSIYCSILCWSKTKYLITTQKLYKSFFSFFFKQTIFSFTKKTKFDEIKDILNALNFNFLEQDLNIFNDEKFLNNKTYLLPNKFNILHFDEKWIAKQYIGKYVKIQPELDELLIFLKKIIDKSKEDLVITTGAYTNNVIENLKKNFIKINENNFMFKYNDKKIILFINLSFLSLQYIISKSKLLICCHGAASHLATSYNLKLFDIFEESELDSYKKWNSHFRNYSFFYRDKFNTLSEKIINHI